MTKRRGRAKRNRRNLSERTPPVEVTISHVGARGDGVAVAEIGHRDAIGPSTIFAPLTLPGERVVVRPVADSSEGVSCQVIELIETSPDRVEPACKHFGACGGCGLQHWEAAAYQRWKRERVINAVLRAGIQADHVDDLVIAAQGSRRRADFVIRRLESGNVLGFHERGSNRIVSISECPILEAELVALAARLRDAFNKVLKPGENARASVNLLDSGPDLLLTLPGEPDLTILETLSSMAEDLDVCRISTSTSIKADNDTVIPMLRRRDPVIRFAGVEVSPPPGAFLQATQSGATKITDAVLAGIGNATRIVELHAGCGTLTFPLHQHGRVHAVEGDPAAAAALTTAASKAGFHGTVTVETRDLVDRPLDGRELAAYDALVFDPPRAGARAQAERIAEAGPGHVVAVSCNPATFARDARILADAGYKLDRVTPIDQFLWSPHVELVAQFRRGEPV